MTLVPQVAAFLLSPIWTMEEVSGSLEETSNTVPDNKEATPAVDANPYESAPLGSIRAKTQPHRIGGKHGLTRSISEGSKTHLDSSRWTKFTFSRTAPTVASHAQQGDSEIQLSSPVQNNAFISFRSFPPLTPTAGWESSASAVTKNRLRTGL